MSHTTFRNRHSRDQHYGTAEALLYELATALAPGLGTTEDIEDVLEAIDTKLCRLELSSVVAGGFTADAVIAARSFTADAIIERAQAASVTADAVIRATPSDTFTADAWIDSATTGSFTTDAVIKGTQSGTFTANAWIAGGESASLGEFQLGSTQLGE